MSKIVKILSSGGVRAPTLHGAVIVINI